MARDNFRILFAAGRTDTILKKRCEWLLTAIFAGILLLCFRLQGHELLREGSRFFAGLAVNERTSLLARADAVTRCRRFSRGNGFAPRGQACFGLVRVGAPPG